MSPLCLPELIQSTNKGVWAQHPGFSVTTEELTRQIEAIRAQGFQRLRWDNPSSNGSYLQFPESPLQAISRACPPRQGRTSTELLALTLARGVGAELKVGVGFLRYNDRWYFSTTGNNFEQQISSATVWKDIHVSRSVSWSGNER